MSAPPLAPCATSTTALETRQGRTQALANQARQAADEAGLTISQNRLSRLVRRFVTERRPDSDLRAMVIAYADPTGETAVANVMRERSR